MGGGSLCLFGQGSKGFITGSIVKQNFRTKMGHLGCIFASELENLYLKLVDLRSYYNIKVSIETVSQIFR